VNHTGKPYEPTTDLYNYDYRDYAPALARFTMVDPIRDNWFVYVNNDPVNWIDNSGLFPDATAIRQTIFTLAVGGIATPGQEPAFEAGCKPSKEK
jgi:RHS repeat-associated protein